MAADVLVSAYTQVTYGAVVSWGGAQGAWFSPSDTSLAVFKLGAQINEFALTFSGLPRAKIRAATLRLHIGSAASTPTFYLGLVRVPVVPSFSGGSSIDRANNRVRPFAGGAFYATEFAAFTLPDVAPGGDQFLTFDLTRFGSLQGLFYHPSFDGSVRIVATANLVDPVDTPLSADRESDPHPPVLILDHLVPGQTADDDLTGVTGQQVNDRWFKCTRCGMWFPAGDSVPDGERPGLRVCDSGCADLLGRKDMRKPTREREDRLWPRL